MLISKRKHPWLVIILSHYICFNDDPVVGGECQVGVMSSFCIHYFTPLYYPKRILVCYHFSFLFCFFRINFRVNFRVFFLIIRLIITRTFNRGCNYMHRDFNNLRNSSKWIKIYLKNQCVKVGCFQLQSKLKRKDDSTLGTSWCRYMYSFMYVCALCPPMKKLGRKLLLFLIIVGR